MDNAGLPVRENKRSMLLCLKINFSYTNYIGLVLVLTIGTIDALLTVSLSPR